MENEKWSLAYAFGRMSGEDPEKDPFINLFVLQQIACGQEMHSMHCCMMQIARRQPSLIATMCGLVLPRLNTQI